MEKDSRIFVAGHRGMLGRALVRRLRREGHENLLLRTRVQLDLRDPARVRRFFERSRPDHVVLAAARVGGILENEANPAPFLHDNLMIAASVVHAAAEIGVKRLLLFGSNCVYPRRCPQPMREDAILTGPLEPTSGPYAIAKLAGIAMAQAYHRQHGSAFLALIPATLYGPGDDFDPRSSHVLSGLLRRFHEALPDREVAVWGSGDPVREFLHVDDLADACLFLLGREAFPAPGPTNVGTGEGISIRDLAVRIQEATGHRGPVTFDRTKPDGAPEKVLDSSRIRALGWSPRVALPEGLRKTYAWFLRNAARR